MAKSRSTSRARSSARSKKVKAAAAPKPITMAKMLLWAAEAFTAFAMHKASTYAFNGGDRAAGLGYFAAAVASAVTLTASFLGALKLSFVPAQVVSGTRDFGNVWSYYTGYFGMPLIGYSAWVKLGVIEKVCSALGSRCPAVCSGQGDLTDYLSALLLIFIIAVATGWEKRMSAFHSSLFGFGAPIWLNAMKAGGNINHRLAGCVFGAFVFTFIEEGTTLMSQLPPIVKKLRVTTYLTAFFTLGIAYYSYKN